MRKEEYVETIVYNGKMINVGIDDYGQTYFLEYVDETGALVENCVGAYVTDYSSYIEYMFGEPELNCDIINSVKDKCKKADKMYCHKCDHDPLVIARNKRWLKKYGVPYPERPPREEEN